MNVLKQFSGAKLPLIRQTEAAECGLACLAMVAGYHGHKTSLANLRRRFSLSMKGASLKTIMAMAQQLHLRPRPVKAPLELLHKLELPAILHWDLNHFVVLAKISGNKAVIHDPGLGRRDYSLEELSDHYTGVAMELRPAAEFQKVRQLDRLKLSQLWSRMTGMKRTFIQLAVLSIVLQLFVIASPFYMQLVVDEVLTKFDADLLVLLAVGFGLFALINAVAESVRGAVLLNAGSLMSFQMVGNLFRHLVRLPQAFFDKRHMGDIVSRFGSTEPIQKMLTEGVVASLIDGVMAIVTLILMFTYSATLSLIVLSALAIFTILRFAFYGTFRRRSEDAILAKAEENSTFMETVRGMLSIKLFGGEQDRENMWQAKYAGAVNAEVKVGWSQIWFKLFNTLLFGLENVLVIYFAARAVMDGGFSIGMLFAFMAYKRHFVTAAATLVERGIEFRMLDLHLERLADIALSEKAPEEERLETPVPLDGRLTLNDVRFAYGEGEAEVIRGLSLEIEAGQSVAITGASGCGKTTLVKILLGLLPPTQGEVRIDDQPLTRYGVHAFRAQVGAVMQDDQLFAGSLADNIAFFAADVDMEHLVACAQAAAIHDEIMAMPMKYETLIGDMGIALSGGQKQRVLLARALYRRPRLLVLDEGTAHLDTMTEARVNQAVKQLGITRIIIAHRPETILSADRVVVMQDGQIADDKPVAEILAAMPKPQAQAA